MQYLFVIHGLFGFIYGVLLQGILCLLIHIYLRVNSSSKIINFIYWNFYLTIVNLINNFQNNWSYLIE